MEDDTALGTSRSTLGKSLYEGIRQYADQNHVEIEGLPKDPKADVPPEVALSVLRNFLPEIFPRLAPAAADRGQAPSDLSRGQHPHAQRTGSRQSSRPQTDW
jgi:hypothetical protein